jgi:hypothetical protein
MTRASLQPSRVASWLIELFTPCEQTESISGDLLEEFSDLAPKSGGAYARPCRGFCLHPRCVRSSDPMCVQRETESVSV